MANGVDRLTEVMDRLRSPGGCPWDAEQTHESLVRYAIEETYEFADAVEVGSRAEMREELGDVLLQVVFHARIAQEHADEPFDLDDVANTCADKLIQRHPHVFDADYAAAGEISGDGSAPPTTASAVRERWDDIKARTQGRESVMDGVPAALPALARAQKVLGRATRAKLAVRDPAGVSIGQQLFALVARAQAEGVDAETELRDATRAFEAAAREAEAGVTKDSPGAPPTGT
ncbi:MazG family protein [Demequina oxidasica]|uniref:MazG family protein n=1 Tax=Demequina oxidasica TaxID=676199 RepID=UPI001F341CF0|nr:MazG family protein [Demequina oxidasica]